MYYPQNVISMITLRRMMWAAHIIHMRDEKLIVKLAGKSEGKISVERPRHGWLNLAQDGIKLRDPVNKVTNIWVP